jgi:hypothetical protein
MNSNMKFIRVALIVAELSIVAAGTVDALRRAPQSNAAPAVATELSAPTFRIDERDPRMSPTVIAYAIFDATGARIRQIPFTPERVKAVLAG